MFNFNKNKKTFREYKKSLEPREKFVRDTERVFISTFKEKFPERAPSHSYVFTYLARGLATSVAVMALAITTSTYANYKNVDASNVLYPLKRLNESIRLSIASDENKSTLHLEFAERRMTELAALKNENMGNGKISELANEAKEEVKKSFATTVTSKSDVVSTAPAAQMKTTRESNEPLSHEPIPAKDDERIRSETIVPVQEKLYAPQAPGTQLPSTIQDTKDIMTPQKQIKVEKQFEKMETSEEIIVAEPQKTRILPTTRFTRPCETLKRIFESEFSEVQKAVREDLELKIIFEKECLLILR